MNQSPPFLNELTRQHTSARLYIEKYQDHESYDFDEEPAEGSPERNASLLIGLTTIKPYFVEQAEKIEERKKKGPVAVAFYKVLEKFVWPLVVFSLMGFILWILGTGFWDMGKGMLGSVGLIEYQTKGEKRYEKFLEEVSSCVLTDALHSSEKTHKWPIYATYECPDGSKKTWKREVKVITEVGDKIIVE